MHPIQFKLSSLTNSTKYQLHFKQTQKVLYNISTNEHRIYIPPHFSGGNSRGSEPTPARLSSCRVC